MALSPSPRGGVRAWRVAVWAVFCRRSSTFRDTISAFGRRLAGTLSGGFYQGRNEFVFTHRVPTGHSFVFGELREILAIIVAECRGGHLGHILRRRYLPAGLKPSRTRVVRTPGAAASLLAKSLGGSSLGQARSYPVRPVAGSRTTAPPVEFILIERPIYCNKLSLAQIRVIDTSVYQTTSYENRKGAILRPFAEYRRKDPSLPLVRGATLTFLKTGCWRNPSRNKDL